MPTHDYVIANGTGSSVRSDINDALAAIVSQNSSSTAPATTYAYMIWVDTTTNIVKMRNGANSAWIELFETDGEFGSKTFNGNVTLNAQGDLRFADSDSSNWVAFQAPATVASNVTWTLPNADGTSGQTLQTNGSGTLSWVTPSATVDKIEEGNTSAEVVDTGSDGHFKVTTEGTERLRCDSSGRLLVGTSSAYVGYGGSSSNKLQIAGSQYTDAGLSAFVFGSTTVGGYLNLGLSRNTTVGSHTVVQSGDTLGSITFNGSDGATFKAAADISCYVDATPGTNDMPGRIVLATTADGASSPTERMRIDSSGRLLVGATSARATFFNDTTAPRLQVEGVDEASASISIYSNENNADGPYLFLGKGRGGSVGSTTQVNSDDRLGTIQFAGLDQSAQVTAAAQIYAEVDGTPAQSGEDMPGRLIFATSADNSGSLTPTERLRIDKEGRLYNQNAYDSTTATAANLVVQSDGRFIRSTSSGKYKTDVETLEDSYADALLDCRPVWYRSLSSADNPAYGYWGFIAEEVAEIDPRLVHWKTTEPVVQENGSLEHVPCEPEPEGVAYDRFVPHLLNLIKRQKEQIEYQGAAIAALEARLTALESA